MDTPSLNVPITTHLKTNECWRSDSSVLHCRNLFLVCWLSCLFIEVELELVDKGDHSACKVALFTITSIILGLVTVIGLISNFPLRKRSLSCPTCMVSHWWSCRCSILAEGLAEELAACSLFNVVCLIQPGMTRAMQAVFVNVKDELCFCMLVYLHHSLVFAVMLPKH